MSYGKEPVQQAREIICDVCGKTGTENELEYQFSDWWQLLSGGGWIEHYCSRGHLYDAVVAHFKAAEETEDAD